jgi:hypothetical protein
VKKRWPGGLIPPTYRCCAITTRGDQYIYLSCGIPDFDSTPLIQRHLPHPEHPEHPERLSRLSTSDTPPYRFVLPPVCGIARCSLLSPRPRIYLGTNESSKELQFRNQPAHDGCPFATFVLLLPSQSIEIHIAMVSFKRSSCRTLYADFSTGSYGTSQFTHATQPRSQRP